MKEELVELPEIPKSDYFFTKEHAVYLDIANQMKLQEPGDGDQEVAAAVAPNIPLLPTPSSLLNLRHFLLYCR